MDGNSSQSSKIIRKAKDKRKLNQKDLKREEMETEPAKGQVKEKGRCSVMECHGVADFDLLEKGLRKEK